MYKLPCTDLASLVEKNCIKLILRISTALASYYDTKFSCFQLWESKMYQPLQILLGLWLPVTLVVCFLIKLSYGYYNYKKVFDKIHGTIITVNITKY